MFSLQTYISKESYEETKTLSCISFTEFSHILPGIGSCLTTNNIDLILEVLPTNIQTIKKII